jgi:hypothetical protein
MLILTTFDLLKTALQAWLIDTANEDKVTTDADVLRFIAAQNAHELHDMGRRDTINLFVEGIPPMSKERVVEWLEIAEECAEDDPDSRPDWDVLFEDFYGPKVV